ncbi:hypothetical protein [Raoultella ornithinolytica]|uniref:hypothetical protein n=1 Tax=Raoultella ornithinolytica TaxID=54291 RepID=UPI0013C2E7E2|nr:hypothetical protein [Raoultella ornithinolytica]
MKKTAATALLTLGMMNVGFAYASHTPQVLPGWALVGTSDQADVYIKESSFKFDGNNITAVSQIFMFQQNQTVSVYRMSISSKSCKEGVGVIIVSPISANVGGPAYWDYVDGGANIASSTGQYICSVFAK